MPQVGLKEAARLTGKNQSTIHRAMKSGKLSYKMGEDGERVVDVAELDRVFQVSPDGKPVRNDNDVLHAHVEELARLRAQLEAERAMQAVAKEIHASETLVDVEDRIASVNELFRLQDADEYSEAENRYLSASRASASAVVLAASRGAGLEAVTADRPKVMLPIAGKPLLRWLVDAFKKQGVNDITVVGGYHALAAAGVLSSA